MSQHDYVIANAGGAAVRADINAALLAVQSNNAGSSAPSATAAGMFWVDTSADPYVLKIRDKGNTHWLTVGEVGDPAADGMLVPKLVASSTGLKRSDGTALLSEDGSNVATLNNVTLGGAVTGFPAVAVTSADLPVGTVLQVISTAKRDVWSSAHSNNSFNAITGMSVAIPTSAAANKVLVQYHVSFSHDAGSHAGMAFALYRNGSIITDATASAVGGGGQVAVTNIAMPVEFNAGGGASGTASMSYLDTPGSAATHTYALYAFNASTSAFHTYVNRVTNDAYATYGTRGISTITATEVVG